MTTPPQQPTTHAAIVVTKDDLEDLHQKLDDAYDRFRDFSQYLASYYGDDIEGWLEDARETVAEWIGDTHELTLDEAPF